MGTSRERLLIRAATIDERLSPAFECLSSRKVDAEPAAVRLAAWCRAATGGDWALFERRLQRDGWSMGTVLPRLATVRPTPGVPTPIWLTDADWIEAALQAPTDAASSHPFGELVAPLVAAADERLWQSLATKASGNLAPSARECLRENLFDTTAKLLAPALYERFADIRAAGGSAGVYRRFVRDMADGGIHAMFEQLPVLLRLLATVTRQWLETSHELITRLDTDLAGLGDALLGNHLRGPVVRLEGGLSDPHEGGRSVHLLTFEDGARLVYKPKDVRFDAAWGALVDRLNDTGAPITLRAVRTLACDGYGWTEFIEHVGCTDGTGAARFFRRAGAWLALFHCFASTDMHHENMLAAGEHPVPIDLEMALQAPTEDRRTPPDAELAFRAAADRVAESVIAVGLLPSYGKAPDNTVFAVGGVTSERTARVRLGWQDVNSDAMRPERVREQDRYIPNLPLVAGRRASLQDHMSEFVGGFEDYARFIQRRSAGTDLGGMFEGFADTSLRAVLRPTRFYGMLLDRLRDHRQMGDGVLWSSQADFVARLTDWDDENDPLWNAQRAERAALLELNVPRFVAASDATEIRDASGTTVQTESVPGLTRARQRVAGLDDKAIAWQVDVIRQSTIVADRNANSILPQDVCERVPGAAELRTHADAIADELCRHAMLAGPGAAWIGLDWLGDSEVSQLAALDRDLYGGASGIAVFLAAHAAVTGADRSACLARGALAAVRSELRGRNAARIARSIGIGAGTGLGSVIYSLVLVADSLGDAEMLAEAHAAAALFTDDLIAADRQLDVMGGAAGAALALLRLHRQTPSAVALDRAVACGRQLLTRPRAGSGASRSWKGQGPGEQPLNGMSHGAAGFALALAALAAASGDRDFAAAAMECIDFENSSYDPHRRNWPDLRFAPTPKWPSQWCHGATGIGLARAATLECDVLDGTMLRDDVRHALAATEQGWPARSDILCCGALGGVEFLRAAGQVLGRDDLAGLAARRLKTVLDIAATSGDYRWTGGDRRFNLGLFRGLAGVGYTVLRQLDDSIPNVLVWG